jgi:hypothetical protein
MVFFTCFFPFLIVLLRLSSKFFNSVVHAIAH